MFVEKDGIRFFTSPLLESCGGLKHAFMTRVGGVSSSPYKSLNMGLKEGDSKKNVEENRERLSTAFGFPPLQLTTVDQVHGFMMVTVRDNGGPTYSRIQADGLTTLTPEVPLGILTADCVPLLLHDPVKKVAAAVHAGWRGAAAGIITRSINIMASKFGTDRQDLIAAIGPHIGPCCYVVGSEVLDAFSDTFGDEIKELTRRASEGNLSLDLGIAARIQLLTSGVRESNIDTLSECTSCREDLFFSHRRDGSPSGRQLSFIMLEE